MELHKCLKTKLKVDAKVNTLTFCELHNISLASIFLRMFCMVIFCWTLSGLPLQQKRDNNKYLILC